MEIIAFDELNNFIDGTVNRLAAHPLQPPQIKLHICKSPWGDMGERTKETKGGLCETI